MDCIIACRDDGRRDGVWKKAIVEGDGVVVGSTVEGFLSPDEQDDDGNVIVDLHFRVVE